MIAGLFGGSLLVFRQYEFVFARFYFTDRTAIKVEQTVVEIDDKQGRNDRRYDLIFEEEGVEIERWSPWDEKNPIFQDRMRFDIDRLAAVDDRVFRDQRTGQRLDPAEAWERYPTSIPATALQGGMLSIL